MIVLLKPPRGRNAYWIVSTERHCRIHYLLFPMRRIADKYSRYHHGSKEQGPAYRSYSPIPSTSSSWKPIISDRAFGMSGASTKRGDDSSCLYSMVCSLSPVWCLMGGVPPGIGTMILEIEMAWCSWRRTKFYTDSASWRVKVPTPLPL